MGTDDCSVIRVFTDGGQRLAVDSPGDYAFLLEKGREYALSVEPFSPDISFAAVDDLAPPVMLGTFGFWNDWTVDGGGLRLVCPTFSGEGRILWMPTLQATPPPEHLGPGSSPVVFSAELSDYAYGQRVYYEWSSDDSNVGFGSPHSADTTIDVREMPSWDSARVTARVLIGTNALESAAVFTYGLHAEPTVALLVDAPAALLLNSNAVDSAKIGAVAVSFVPDIETNGVLSVVCLSGGDRVSLSGECSRRVTDGTTLNVGVEGVEASEEVGDVVLAAVFTPDGESSPVTNSVSLTVVQVNNVHLPGAPNDGLVVLRGTSVALDVDIVPGAAKSLLATVYSVRRLRGDGTYEDWRYAAGNYRGTSAIYDPAEGGIYQVQASVGVGWGVADVRYYVWEDYSDYEYGLNVPGDVKAFGVCDEEWQLSVRNNAKIFVGDTSYGFESSVDAYEGFSAVGSDTWKCNVFVAHRLVQSHLPVPAVHHGRFNLKNWPPLANEWGDSIFEIEHWTILDGSSYPQPGMIAIKPSDGPNGHMGILDFDGMAISAQATQVTRASNVSKWGNAVYRRYTDE